MNPELLNKIIKLLDSKQVTDCSIKYTDDEGYCVESETMEKEAIEKINNEIKQLTYNFYQK